MYTTPTSGTDRSNAERHTAARVHRPAIALMTIVTVLAAMFALAPSASANSSTTANALECTAVGGTLTWNDVGSGKYKVYSKAPGDDRYDRIEKTRDNSYTDDDYEPGTTYQVRYKSGDRVTCDTAGSAAPISAPLATDPSALPCFDADDAELDNEPNNRHIELEIDLDTEGTVDLSGLAAQIGSFVEVPASVDAEDGEEEMDWIAGSVSLQDLPRETVVTLDGEPIKLCWELKESSPIGLDLDGSGAVERIGGEFKFDFDADGSAETVGEWFAPTEGILVDTDLAGAFTGDHLFGDQGGLYTDGFAKLARLDVNADGRVAGTELAGLGVWLDANSNAVADAGEVQPISSYDVVSLSTSHTGFVSVATLADGSTMVTEDLWFPVVAVGTSTNTRVAAIGMALLAIVAIAAVSRGRRREDLGTPQTSMSDEAFDEGLAQMLDGERVR